MGKYDHLKVLKTTTSSRDQQCAKCRGRIPVGEQHLRETLTDRRINFIGKRFHSDCDKKPHGEGLRLEDFQ